MDTYEKKYKEALKRAKTLYENANGMILKKWVEQVFPELCESEDERIRNRLIDYFYGFLDGFEDTYKVGGHVKWEGLDVKNVIAWLENIPYTIDHEKREGFHLGYKAGLESQGEQNVSVAEFKAKELDAEKKELKPIFDVEIPYGAKDSELQEVCYHIPEGFHAEIEGNKVIIKKGEKKSNWSEEDEDMRYKATAVIHRLCTEGKEYVWSIKILEKLFYWLKSLRPQNHWKPSEEQMETLWSTTEKYLESDNENVRKLRGEVLESLYEDLKKLKE